MDGLEFRKAMATLREMFVQGNNYIAKTEPWKVAKVNQAYAGTILYTALNLIRLYARLITPLMPTTAQRMNSILNLPADPVWVPVQMNQELAVLKVGDKINPAEPLFQKISPERIEELRIKHKETE